MDRLLAFLEHPGFTADWHGLGLGDDDLHALQTRLLNDPIAAPVVPGSGGLRKIRFSPPLSGRGKSGAYRIGYTFFDQLGIVLLVIAYPKNRMETIPPAVIKAIRREIEAIEHELKRSRRLGRGDGGW